MAATFLMSIPVVAFFADLVFTVSSGTFTFTGFLSIFHSSRQMFRVVSQLGPWESVSKRSPVPEVDLVPRLERLAIPPLMPGGSTDRSRLRRRRHMPRWRWPLNRELRKICVGLEWDFELLVPVEGKWEVSPSGSRQPIQTTKWGKLRGVGV